MHFPSPPSLLTLLLLLGHGQTLPILEPLHLAFCLHGVLSPWIFLAQPHSQCLARLGLGT